MPKVVILVTFWMAVVVLRAQIPINIRPWELLWILWVLLTTLLGGCIAWSIRDVMEERKRDGGDKTTID